MLRVEKERDRMIVVGHTEQKESVRPERAEEGKQVSCNRASVCQTDTIPYDVSSKYTGRLTTYRVFVSNESQLLRNEERVVRLMLGLFNETSWTASIACVRALSKRLLPLHIYAE